MRTWLLRLYDIVLTIVAWGLFVIVFSNRYR